MNHNWRRLKLIYRIDGKFGGEFNYDEADIHDFPAENLLETIVLVNCQSPVCYTVHVQNLEITGNQGWSCCVDFPEPINKHILSPYINTHSSCYSMSFFGLTILLAFWSKPIASFKSSGCLHTRRIHAHNIIYKYNQFSHSLH